MATAWIMISSHRKTSHEKMLALDAALECNNGLNMVREELATIHFEEKRYKEA